MPCSTATRSIKSFVFIRPSLLQGAGAASDSPNRLSPAAAQSCGSGAASFSATEEACRVLRHAGRAGPRFCRRLLASSPSTVSASVPRVCASTGAYFSLAPFVGALLAVAMLGVPLSVSLVIAGGLMGFGLWLHLVERHEHEHLHEPPMEHEHRHHHDEHHRHGHALTDPPGEPHTHWHLHAPLVHRHPHYPDLHHRHGHPRLLRKAG